MPTDKQAQGSPVPLLDRIARALEITARTFDEWIVERERARAQAWLARHWPEAAVPLPDTKYVWPHVFKHKGHPAMLVTGYPEKGSSWDDVRAFYERESITVQGVTHTPPVWVPEVRAFDRRDLAYTALVLLFKAIPALASLLRVRMMFNNAFGSWSNVRWSCTSSRRDHRQER